MRGLFTTILIITGLISAGIISSVIITVDLNDGLTSARERGFEEGRQQGYERGLLEGGRVGYQDGSRAGYRRVNWGDGSSYATGSYFLYNPTYDEVSQVLAEGQAGTARKIHDYAEANGIRVAYVRTPIAREAAEGMVYIYQLVAFDTVDRGLVIIEPWSYEEVAIEVGKRYSELNGRPRRIYDDTITEINIVW